MVLAHHLRRPSHGRGQSGLPSHFNLLLLWAAALLLCSQLVCAQTVVNGQTFTEGLAILDSPSSGSSFQVGANMDVVIEMTGNGKLPTSASLPNSTQPTRMTSLEIYLVSQTLATNITVSQGPALLANQSGSVAHIPFTIPTCAVTGDYNLTFYEYAFINGSAFFSITPIPVHVRTSRPGAPCSTLFNPILALPQAQAPPQFQPWLNQLNPGAPGSVSASGSASASTSGSTSSASASGSASSGSASGSASASTSGGGTVVTITLGPSGVSGPVSTKTIDGATTTVTVEQLSTRTTVISSVQTQLETVTASGTTEVLTATITSVTTSTITSTPTGTSGGFFPVNAGLRLAGGRWVVYGAALAVVLTHFSVV